MKKNDSKVSQKVSKFSKLILALCELVLGVVLLVNPVGFTNLIIIVSGILLLAYGLMSTVHYFRLSPAQASEGQALTQGMLLIAGGIFCILKSNWFMATFPLLTVLYGIITLITGISKIQWTVDLIRTKASKWFWAAISAVITLICSVIILCNPFSSTVIIWNFIAITLVVEAVFDVVVAFFADKGNAKTSEENPEA